MSWDAMRKEIGELVLSQAQIAAGITRVAAVLNARLESVVAIVVVPGGLFFAADLLRQLTGQVKVDYISCPHTPGERNNASPIVFADNLEIAGQDVLLVDDAVESGGTMKRLVAHVSAHQPASITVATLFVKPGRVDVGADVVFAYELESDELLVGYGLPWRDAGRNVPEVHRVIQG